MNKKDRFEMRVTYDEKAFLEVAAGWEGLSLSGWARQLLLKAAHKSAKAKGLCIKYPPDYRELSNGR